MSDALPTLNVVLEWKIGPRSESPPGVIFGLLHVALPEGLVEQRRAWTWVVLTPDQAAELSEALAKSSSQALPPKKSDA